MKTSDQKINVKKGVLLQSEADVGCWGVLGCSGVFWGEDGIIETQKESVRKKRREGVIESTGIT